MLRDMSCGMRGLCGPAALARARDAARGQPDGSDGGAQRRAPA